MLNGCREREQRRREGRGRQKEEEKEHTKTDKGEGGRGYGRVQARQGQRETETPTLMLLPEDHLAIRFCAPVQARACMSACRFNTQLAQLSDSFVRVSRHHSKKCACDLVIKGGARNGRLWRACQKSLGAVAGEEKRRGRREDCNKGKSE